MNDNIQNESNANIEKDIIYQNDDVSSAENIETNIYTENKDNIADAKDEMNKSQRKSFFVSVALIVLACLVVVETAFIASFFVFSPKTSANTSDTGDISATIATIAEINEFYKRYYVNDYDTENLDQKAIYSFLLSTGDKYCDYYTSEQWQEEMDVSNGNSYGIGANVVNTEDGIVIVYIMSDSPASLSDLQVGDIIIKIDDANVADYYYTDAIELIKGQKGSSVTLTVLRDGKEIVIPVKRGSYTSETVRTKYIKRDGKKLAHIYISEFLNITAKQFKNAVQNAIDEKCDGIIFDLRNNPGGQLETVTDILDYLLPEGPITSVEYKDSKRNFTYKSDAEYATDLPMVILVNESTASGGELFTSALQDYKRATVIGTQTYGKGCGQSYYNLSNGDMLRMTSFFYLPPYSENYDGVGIKPDIVSELSEEAKNKILWLLTQEEDSQLSTAVETIIEKIQ